MKEEITFEIDDEIFAKAEKYAAENGTTVSVIVTQFLEELAFEAGNNKPHL